MNVLFNQTLTIQPQGRDFPTPDTIAKGYYKLRQKADGSNYSLGTLGADTQLGTYFNKNCALGVCAVFFDDGTIMLVEVPTVVHTQKSGTVNVQGILAYSIIKTQVDMSVTNPQVISQAEYDQKFLSEEEDGPAAISAVSFEELQYYRQHNQYQSPSWTLPFFAQSLDLFGFGLTSSDSYRPMSGHPF